MKIGIVGLPNVGKSTLFNALLKKQRALAANYPFATIEPNVGIVEVKDERVDQLAKLVEITENLNPNSIPRRYATIEFVDIAGLVKGASKGEGLGNQFLAAIREVDLICHVMRAFDDPDVVVTGKMDPIEDLEIIRIELALKDLETVNKALEAKVKDFKQKQIRNQTLTKIKEILEAGHMLNTQNFTQDEWEVINPLCLISVKPEIFAINISEDKVGKDIDHNYAKELKTNTKNIVYVCAKMEQDISLLSQDEQKLYLADFGLKLSGIEQVAQVAFSKLDLISFLTTGVIEARAWQVKKGTLAPQAAGTIHTDFAKKFIKANIVTYQDFIENKGWKNCKENGKIRQEGKDYEIQDGDVIEFMIGQ
jgi:ribosome-binding ATPase